MKFQNGGLKLKNPSKTGFTPIYDMINSASGHLELLTYSSLKGFMFTLNVNDVDSEYLKLSGVRFTTPVTSFILKFAVLSPLNDTQLPDYKGKSKATESEQSYYEEAKLQQMIWKNSIAGGRPEICPSVANFSLFNNENGKNLLTFFTRLGSKITPDAINIFKYLFNCLKNETTYGIGVIVMPKVEKSETFGDFIDMPNGINYYGFTMNTEYRNDAYANVIAQTVRLFIDTGVIHFDLHANNALVFLASDNKIKSVIIDFGRASNLNSGENDDYLPKDEKETILSIKKDYYHEFFKISQTNSDDEKRAFIFDVMNFISFKDNEKNQQLFNFSNPFHYQMIWFNDIISDRNSFIPVKAFDILKRNIISQGSSILPATIKGYEDQGLFVNFNRGINSFSVQFPVDLIPSCQDSGIGCSIMGGKTRNKKSRKTKKTKKSRKTKKTKKSRRYFN
jgi:hypothetical protein